MMRIYAMKSNHWMRNKKIKQKHGTYYSCLFNKVKYSETLLRLYFHSPLFCERTRCRCHKKNKQITILTWYPQITQSFLPPPGAITPSPPPDVIDNNFPVYHPVTNPPPSTSNVPTSVGTTESAKTQETLPQDIPTVFQPHDPSSNASTDSNHQPSSKGNTYPPPYNVSANDSHPTNSVDHDKKDYPEIPDNEIGENSAANSAKEGTSTKGTVGVGIPQQNGNGDGNMALVTTIPIVAIFVIILITAATLYLVNRRNKIKKRPVKEIVSYP